MGLTRFRWHPDATLHGGAVAAGENPLLAAPYDSFAHRLFDLINQGREPMLGQLADHPEDADMICLQTGGTTGATKLIRRSHASWIASFDINQHLFGITAADCYGILGGFEHSLSVYALVEALHLGADVVMAMGLPPRGQINRLAGVSMIYATPSQIRLLAKSNGALPDLRLIIIGGGALDAGTQQIAQQLAPNAALYEFYGAAETSFVTLSDHKIPKGSVGRAYPGVTIDIRDGEVWVNSPYLFDGYDGKKPEWVSAGELGELNGDGYLYLQGRRSRMFTVADQNVYPERIETYLLSLDGVQEAAVLSIPDNQRGNIPIVALLGSISPELVQNTVGQKFGNLCRPTRVIPMADWPRLPSGKTDLAEIARRIT